LALSGRDTVHAAEVILSGGLVAIPTETVYGLAGNALDPDAVVKIFKAKNRPFFDPLIIHVSDIRQCEKYVVEFPALLRKLADQWWPGPLTLLLPKDAQVPDLVTAGNSRVAVRVPGHPLTRELLELTGLPLAAPSANPFGFISPTRPEHVLEQLGDKIDYVLDGGPCAIGIESTICGMEDGQLTVYRLGGIPVEDIETTTGVKPVLRVGNSGDPEAPGQTDRHYAPLARLILTTDPASELEKRQHRDPALLLFGQEYNHLEARVKMNLSLTGNMEEAAVNLFDYLRKLDAMKPGAIIAQSLPENGLGPAVNDRLRRGSVKG
jgi:L-threonylcarbamoyladenylate synthase